MFEQALFEHISDNFTVAGADLSFGFGVIDESIEAPYIIMHVLDSDGDPQALCDTQFVSGDSFIQWNIYDQSPQFLFKIKRDLDLFITSLRTLTLGAKSYNIGLIQHEPSPSANIIDNGLAVDVLAKTITYKEN